MLSKKEVQRLREEMHAREDKAERLKAKRARKEKEARLREDLQEREDEADRLKAKRARKKKEARLRQDLHEREEEDDRLKAKQARKEKEEGLRQDVHEREDEDERLKAKLPRKEKEEGLRQDVHEREDEEKRLKAKQARKDKEDRIATSNRKPTGVFEQRAFLVDRNPNIPIDLFRIMVENPVLACGLNGLLSKVKGSTRWCITVEGQTECVQKFKEYVMIAETFMGKTGTHERTFHVDKQVIEGFHHMEKEIDINKNDDGVALKKKLKTRKERDKSRKLSEEFS